MTLKSVKFHHPHTSNFNIGHKASILTKDPGEIQHGGKIRLLSLLNRVISSPSSRPQPRRGPKSNKRVLCVKAHVILLMFLYRINQVVSHNHTLLPLTHTLSYVWRAWEEPKLGKRRKGYKSSS
jgi:hypothetical protein